MKYHKITNILLLVTTLFIISCGDDDDDDGPILDNPIADAGANQTLDLEQTVTLDGSASTGNLLTYSWVVTDPTGGEISLSDASLVNPTFVASIAGVYNAVLTITNGVGNSDMAMSEVTVVNPTYQLADQMGRPAINTVFNFFGDADTKNNYNQVLPEEGAGLNSSAFKDIFDALQGYIGLDPDTYLNLLGLDNATTATVLATDVLGSNKSAPSTYGPSDLGNIVLGENVLNGRALGDDVVDVTLILTFAGDDLASLTELQQGLIGDNVNANDKNFLATFPYLAAPH